MLLTSAAVAILYGAAYIVEVKRLDQKITLFSHNYESIFPSRKIGIDQAELDCEDNVTAVSNQDAFLEEPGTSYEKLRRIIPLYESCQKILDEFSLVKKYALVIPQDLRLKENYLKNILTILSAQRQQIS